jgi:hypothetical protein
VEVRGEGVRGANIEARGIVAVVAVKAAKGD